MVAVAERPRAQPREHTAPLAPPIPPEGQRFLPAVSTKEQVGTLWTALRSGQIAFVKLEQLREQTVSRNPQADYIDDVPKQHGARLSSNRITAEDRTLRQDDTIENLAAAVTRGSDAFEKLLAQYDPLVKYVMGRMVLHSQFPLQSPDDYYQEGRVGLIDAVKRFDPSFGVKFETYAIARIRGAILDMERELSFLDRGLVERMTLVGKKTAAFNEKKGREPTEQELSEATGLSKEQLREARVAAAVSFVSIERPISNDGESEATPQLLRDHIPGDDRQEPHNMVEKQEKVSTVQRAIGQLPDREQRMLHLYYDRGLTMREIASVLGVSEARVFQLHSRALHQRIKTHMEEHGYQAPPAPPQFVPREHVIFQRRQNNRRARVNGALLNYPAAPESNTESSTSTEHSSHPHSSRAGEI